MPEIVPSRSRKRGRKLFTETWKLSKLLVLVSRVETAPVSFPYCGSYGFDITSTEETTSIGTLIPGLPVAGSVALALFTRAPLWVVRAPFMLMRPSGPRTTPGSVGRTLSVRSSRFGAFRRVRDVIVPDGEAEIEGSSFAVVVTVTDSWTVMGFKSSET